MLFTLQRYEFFSKSQLLAPVTRLSLWCCLPYKGTNFSANHNVVLLLFLPPVMLFTLQRYEFFSKSQPFVISISITIWCCLPYKGTNFSANHNQMKLISLMLLDVVYPTKVRIFQQITTGSLHDWECCMMLFTLQRYEFFSKSQHLIMRVMLRQRCCLPYKGTNFSANHNKIIVLYTYRLDVVY